MCNCVIVCVCMCVCMCVCLYVCKNIFFNMHKKILQDRKWYNIISHLKSLLCLCYSESICQSIGPFYSHLCYRSCVKVLVFVVLLTQYAQYENKYVWIFFLVIQIGPLSNNEKKKKSWLKT